ncbi:alpha-L-rhamnosidase [Lactobacillus colini]|uniref:Alpha-L-rhamnosidase n=1 Tax=Lactobacillus colini TaxID=1819254 RepID=A0ABS4MBV9_9LACO|nr:alpha-rhamnosidase [Lactobacillus colini]MBP2057149.1 alpha-L-rhamnosidase [Lactobacillus colini]
MDFQENRNIKFIHNQYLLEKAEKLKPQLIKHSISPTRLVDIVPDNTNVYNFSAKESHQSLDSLSNYSFGKGERIVFDFGDHYVGHFKINISSLGSPMDAPLFLHLKFAELPVELAEDSDGYQGMISKSWLQDEYIHLDTLPQTLALPRRYSCRYVAIDVIDTSPKWKAVFSKPVFTAESSVELNQVTPVNTKNKKLNKIDSIGLKTLQDCMQQVFEDGPKRDRRLWLGDLHLQALANYATFNNKELVERCLYLFGALPAEDGRITTNIFTFTKPIPDDTFFFDYGLFFISTLYDFYKQFQDKQVLDDLYLVAKQELDSVLTTLNKDYIIEPDKNWFIFVDWNMNFDRNTCGQAILIYALRQFIKLVEIENDQENITKYKAILTKMIKSSKEKLFDKKIGLFISGNDREINLASQVWMVLAHVLTNKENYNLMTKVIKLFFPIHDIATPYMYHYIVESLFESNHSNDAIKLIEEYWGKMVDYGADTFWEAFDPNKPDDSPYGSLAINSFCHAWSCTPVYLIRKYITHTIN